MTACPSAGGCLPKNSHAFFRARNFDSRSASSDARWRFSYEYTLERASSRRPNAASPAGAMSPRAVSSSTFLMLTALQLLFGFRGVNRWTRLVSSIRRATLSIQPEHRAWSTASDHVMLDLPEAFL